MSSSEGVDILNEESSGQDSPPEEPREVNDQEEPAVEDTTEEQKEVNTRHEELEPVSTQSPEAVDEEPAVEDSPPAEHKEETAPLEESEPMNVQSLAGGDYEEVSEHSSVVEELVDTDDEFIEEEYIEEEMADEDIVDEDTVEEEVIEDLDVAAVEGEEVTAEVDEVIDDQDVAEIMEETKEIEEEVDDHGIAEDEAETSAEAEVDTSDDNVDIPADEYDTPEGQTEVLPESMEEEAEAASADVDIPADEYDTPEGQTEEPPVPVPVAVGGQEDLNSVDDAIPSEEAGMDRDFVEGGVEDAGEVDADIEGEPEAEIPLESDGIEAEAEAEIPVESDEIEAEAEIQYEHDGIEAEDEIQVESEEVRDFEDEAREGGYIQDENEEEGRFEDEAEQEGGMAGGIYAENEDIIKDGDYAEDHGAEYGEGDIHGENDDVPYYGEQDGEDDIHVENEEYAEDEIHVENEDIPYLDEEYAEDEIHVESEDINQERDFGEDHGEEYVEGYDEDGDQGQVKVEGLGESEDDVYAHTEEERSSDEGFANLAPAVFAGAATGAAAGTAANTGPIDLDDPEFGGFGGTEETSELGERSEMVEQSVQTDKWDDSGARGLAPLLLLVACCCLVLIVLAITLPLVLIDNDDGERNLVIPTSSPTAFSPTRPPTDTPFPTGTPTVTMAPTSAPPLLSWLVAGGPFTASSNTVALTDQFMAVGDLTSDAGSVQSYINNNGVWEEFQVQQGDQTGGRFGFDVSIAESAMLVGAPGIFVEQTSVPAGAAYYYEYDRNSLEWQQLGSAMLSDGDLVSANEEFGYSVDLSATSRVVIGAPVSNSAQVGAAVGRVYSFEFQQVDPTSPEFDWLPMQDVPIKGISRNAMLGSAVAISANGNRFVAGAPGSGSGMGEVFLYEWVVDSWQELGSVLGEGLEALGTAVSILADDGSVFAVGAPGFGNDRGVVRVYSTEQSGARAGEFVQIGPDIVGNAGEQLGGRNSISGSADSADTPIVILSTASGSLKRLEYDESKAEWVSRFEVIETGSSGLTGSASAADIVAAIGGGTVAIYEPGDANPPTSPTPPTPTSPAPTPTSSTGKPTRPIDPTPSPTGPTGVPTPVPDPVRVVGGPFAGPVFTSFGRSVDISSIIMAVGAAGSEFGQAFLYQFTGTGWEELSPLTGVQMSGRFGSDVAVTGDEVLVGASGVWADQTRTPVGVAYYYQRQVDNTFTQVGSTLRGDEDFFAPLEAFGTSVAASVNRRVVIGAPGSNVGGVVQVGRVYPFEFDVDTQDWVRMQDTPISGGQNDNLGVAVDISNDGSKFVVGAPSNGAGYFEVFVWNDSLSPPEWESVFFRAGSEDFEGFGSGVSMITDNGSLFAVGGPNYMGGQGVIRVYEEGSLGKYSQVGPDIVGEAGEALGVRNTFSGDGMTVIAGTANGIAKRFDYDEVLDEWVQLYDPIDTGFATVAGVAATDAGNTFAAAGSSQATIFEFS